MRAHDDLLIADPYNAPRQRPAPIRSSEDDADMPKQAFKSSRREGKKRSLRQKPYMMR